MTALPARGRAARVPAGECWDWFVTGYQAGVEAGIGMGRAQVLAEEWPVWEQFVDHVRAVRTIPGPLGHRARQDWIRDRQRTADRHPGWSGAELVRRARASWGTGEIDGQVSA